MSVLRIKGSIDLTDNSNENSPMKHNTGAKLDSRCPSLDQIPLTLPVMSVRLWASIHGLI